MNVSNAYNFMEFWFGNWGILYYSAVTMKKTGFNKDAADRYRQILYVSDSSLKINPTFFSSNKENL